MELKHPVCITPRLMAGVKCGGAWISIEYSDRAGREGRIRYRWYVDLPDGQEFTGDDLQSGCQGGGLREGLESLLGFLGACGESVKYQTQTGREGENADLFPPAVAEWAANNTDELSMLSIEAEETEDCIVE